MSGPGALRAILQAARQHGIRRPREAFLATQSPAWQKAFGQSVVKEPQWHYGSFDVGKGNARPNGPMHFGTYKASQDREHNVAFERLEREIRDDLMAEGFEPGPELDAQARREMSAQIENVGIPEHLFDDPQGVKRASYFLDIRNPMRVEDAQAVTERWAELEELARKQGHDALVYSNAVEDRGRDSYVPLNARPQVKAVTAREFNMDDPDVHKAGGGLVKGLKALKATFDAKDGIGAVPLNQSVDYFGFTRKMRPSEFLSLTPDINKQHSTETLEFLRDSLRQGRPLGPPFFSPAWDEARKAWVLRSADHEGRHRMTTLMQEVGDDPVDVHVFPRGGLRARDLSPEMLEAPLLRDGYAPGGLVKGLKAARKGLSAADPEALTPAARLRAADAQWSRSPSIIKAPGGNWLDGSVENAVKGLRVNVPPEGGAEHVRRFIEARPHLTQETRDAITSEYAQADALNRWIDKKLVGYIKNDMATERDPVRALAERGVTHAGMPHMPDEEHDVWLNLLKKRVGRDNIRTVGQSPLARNWEARSDTALDAGTAAFVVEGTPFYLSKTPPEWLVELAAKNPNAPVYNAWHAITPDLGFDHLVDVLREQLATGALTPQQLDKVTMANAVERAHAYNLEREAARKAAQLADLEAMTPYKQYDEGWRWVQLDKPGQFAAESDAMGHSVRGYEPPQGHADWDKVSGKHGSLSYGHGGWDAIKSGRAKIYSLKGPDGKSYATVEAEVPHPALGDPKKYVRFSELAPEQMATFDEYARAMGGDPAHLRNLEATHLFNPESNTIASAAEVNRAPRITQIKGPGNRAPDKAALPYLQDFVRSGKWSDVRDLSNAWFVPIAPDSDLALHLKRSGREVPRFITQDELNEFVRELSALRKVPQ